MPLRLPDLPAILLGIALAPLLVLAPGYFWSRLLELGPVSHAERLAWSLLLSLAAAPILAYNFFLLIPYSASNVWLFAVLQTALPASLCAWLRPEAPATPREPGRYLWIFPALLAAMAVSSVMDVQIGEGLYRGHPASDYVKHIAVTDAIHRTGIHPVNPTFFPGRPLSLFYYFLWFLLCSLLDGLSFWNVGARSAVQAMTAWSVAALFSVVLLLARRFLRPLTRRTVLVCFALVFVAGLDLIPVAAWAFVGVHPGRIFLRDTFFVYPSLDVWNWIGQVTNWLEAAAWVPHHVAATAIGMTGFVLVFGLAPPSRRTAWWVRTGFFAAAAASSLGASIWVTLVFAAFWALWAGLAALRRWWDDLKMLACGAAAAGLLLLPFLYHLFRSRMDPRSPLALNIRATGFIHTYTLFANEGVWKDVLNLAALPLTYFLELGLFLLGGIFWWKHRRQPLGKPQLALVTLLAVSVGLTSVFRSAIDNNDFGWRGFMPAQLILLIATAWMIERLWRLRRRSWFVTACLLLGFAVVPLDWVVMSAYHPLRDLYRLGGQEGRRDFAMKRFYEQVKALTPPDAVIQENLETDLQWHQALYGNRQAVVLDLTTGPLFVGRIPLFEEARKDVTSLFSGSPAEHIVAVSRKYKIDVLVVGDTDPAWNSPVFEDPLRFRRIAECPFARAYALLLPAP